MPELPVLEQLAAFLPIYTEISGGAPVTALDPGRIATFVESFDEPDADLVSFFCASLFEYLHFLRDTGRWSGSEERYRNLHRVLRHEVLNEDVSSSSNRAREPATAISPPATVRERPGNPDAIAGAPDRKPQDLRERHPKTRRT